MQNLLVEAAMSPRRQSLMEIVRQPGISRSDIANRLGLNIATISRLTRDLIDAGLIEESDVSEDKAAKRPGRRFVGLRMRAEGGFIVGIGINAFRQSVTLADLENNKLDEWISPTPPSNDGVSFLRVCFEKAQELLHRNNIAPNRFFGVGLAVAAEVDRTNGAIISAPTFGWEVPFNVKEMAARILNAPLVIETPSLAITQAEGEFGLAQEAQSLVTLHCSLGFGLGVRKATGHSATDFGRVLTKAKSAGHAPRPLDALCGGVSVLNDLLDLEKVAMLSAVEQGKLLSQAIADSSSDAQVAALLGAKGELTAQHFSLTLDVLEPEAILLAGPLAQSTDYVEGFRSALTDALEGQPRILTTEMTPPGASRWLSLRSNVIEGDLDLLSLKMEMAA